MNRPVGTSFRRRPYNPSQPVELCRSPLCGATPMISSDIPAELLRHEQYEILRELGRGGMGVVYLARNRLMKRLEVLKVVNPQLLDRPDTRARFLREISSAAQLH